MLPPPRVGGIELSAGSVSPPGVVATPMRPMNGSSGNATSPDVPTGMTPDGRRDVARRG